jgi:autotransporter-associated beta strand protein
MAQAPILDVGGLIGAWAIYNGTTTTADFASYSATNGVIPMVANTDTTGATWGTTSNLKFSSGTITVPATGQVNSLTLAQTAATTVNLNGNTGRLGSGGVLITGAFASTIAGPGNLTAGQANNTPAELIFTVLTNTATVTANIIDNGTGAVSLTKLGGGTLSLGGTNTFSGPVTVTQGTLVLTTGTALGNSPSVTVRYVPGGGTGTLFQLSGVTISGVTLNLESLIQGGIPGSAAGPVGTNSRTAFQAIGGGTSTWNGPIVLTGNSFSQQYLAGNSSLIINGPVSAGAAGFTGFYFLRGGGTGTMTFNNSINIPNGNFSITDTTNVLLNAPSSGSNNWLNTDVFTGLLMTGANNVLPPTANLVLGQNQSGNTGRASLLGTNQTVAGLNIALGSTGAATSMIVENNAAAGSNSILTFAGNATPSVYAGVLRDGATAGGGTLGLTVTAGSLTLTGTANAFTGPTTVSGGRLGGATTIGGNLTVSGTGTLAPGTTTTPGLLNVGGTATFTGGTFSVKLNGTTAGTLYDQLAVTGAVALGSGVTTLATSLGYQPASGDMLTILTGSSVTGTFVGLPNNATFPVGTFSGTPYTATIQYQAGSVVLTGFTPVPEPAGMLAAAAAAWGLARWGRRRRNTNAEPEA